MVVPMAAALDGDGNYFIVDQLRMVLLKWDPATNSCLGEFYGIGSAPGYFYFPSDVVLDSQGKLYVAQAFEGRVQSYQVPSASSAEPVSVRAAIESAAPSDQEVARLQEPAEGSIGSSPGELALSAEPTSAGSPPLVEALVSGVPDIHQSVVKLVEAWAGAWSDQRVEDYLSAYGNDFVPQAGVSRDEWKRQRRRRLTSPSFIEVELSAMRIEVVDPQNASATFTQAYRSNTYRDVVVKTLDLALEEGAWKIVREVAK
jgi:hypothetical protein